MELVSNTNYRELLKARELLHDCYAQPVLLEEAASTIFLSPWHFQREFTRAFAESPHAYVTRLRIQRAKLLLETTNLSVMEVCLDVGFSSLGSFTSLFARRVGLTPARYRRQVRKLVRVDGIRDRLCIPFCFAQSFGSLG